MKPVINFQIPERQSVRSAAELKGILNGIQNKLAKNYEVVITPWQMQATNMVNITIDSNTDIDEIVRQLNGRECSNRYNFHRKYMPRDIYNVLDFDGDLSIHPLDAMKDWWMPIVEMCNFSKISNNEIFDYLYMNDINPFALISISGDNIDDMDMAISEEAHLYLPYNTYLTWMIIVINNSSQSSDEILKLMKAAGIDPLLVVSIDDKDEGFPWTILDENIRISLGSDINAQYLRAATERRKNRRDIHNGGETI